MEEKKVLNICYVGPVNHGYDEYDSFVVIATDENSARSMAIQKGGSIFHGASVEIIGMAFLDQKPGIVLGSFNAG